MSDAFDGEASAAAAYGTEAAQRAAAVIRERLGVAQPVCGIVLGSGLGALVDDLVDARRIAFGEVPGFPHATIVGHAGAVLTGQLAGREVVALAGRFHLYEGHPAALAGFPARVLHALGVPTLFVSNAAGGIAPTLVPGSLMVIADHLNLMGRNPLVGPRQPTDARFPDMSNAYDRELRGVLDEAARAVGVEVQSGVYAGLLGPTYETPAEVRMLRALGADAVGMSTVPEVIVANALGMRAAGVSCITNLACGIGEQPLDHAEVLDVGARVGREFRALVGEFVRRL